MDWIRVRALLRRPTLAVVLSLAMLLVVPVIVIGVLIFKPRSLSPLRESDVE